MTTPPRRIILLGASNVTRALPVIVDAARRLFGGPLDVLAAFGNGRSYGLRHCWLYFRELPGISACGLWDALRKRPPVPTSALITDVGNDLLYDVPVPQIVEWVNLCADRLQEAGARVVLTPLPLEGILAVTPTQYAVLLAMMFPRCPVTFAAMRERVQELDRQLRDLAGRRGLVLAEPRAEWYGFDVVHLRRRHWSAAWPALLAAAADGAPPAAPAPLSHWRRLTLRLLPPERRWLFGLEQNRPQPAGVLPDGTTQALIRKRQAGRPSPRSNRFPRAPALPPRQGQLRRSAVTLRKPNFAFPRTARPADPFRVRRVTCILVLLVLAGCQAPPARFACGNGCVLPRSREGTLTVQMLADTAVETASHPGRSACSTGSESADFLGSFRRCSTDPGDLEADQLALTGKELRPAAVRLYPDGGEAVAALHDLIDHATQSIDVLMFIWENDPLGWDVARHLAARAGPCLPVRVLVDGGGNLIFGRPETATVAEVNRVVCWLARQPNVHVLRTRNGWARFDHRKLVLVDGREAWSGGRNFTRKAFFGQHDLSFTLAGPLAGELAGTFEHSWTEEGGTPVCCRPAAPDEVPCPNVAARLVYTEPGSHQLADAVLRAVTDARQYVLAENVYFSDGRLIAGLIAARRRGVDVRVVLTIQSDSDVFNRANRVLADRLLRHGVRVYLYPGMTHVKALAVDGCWAYTGSGNFDPLSMRHDRELGLTVSAGPVLVELTERLFRPDLRPEWELHAPLPLSVGDRAAEVLAGLFL
jgi:phosphatidylserine/phosphatidylglycerophosphate/cardiolipin synthase-like enzyme